jgi:hypothetical protein
VLLRADGVAGAAGDPDQCFVVGDGGGGCGEEFGGDGSGGWGLKKWHADDADWALIFADWKSFDVLGALLQKKI